MSIGQAYYQQLLMNMGWAGPRVKQYKRYGYRFVSILRNCEAFPISVQL